MLIDRGLLYRLLLQRHRVPPPDDPPGVHADDPGRRVAPDCHPDTRRLDLLERHRLDLVYSGEAWAVSDGDGRMWAEDWATARSAVDAAGEALAKRARECLHSGRPY